MRVCVFAENGALAKVGASEADITGLLEDLADDTDTTDLVVAVYLLRRNAAWEAHLHEEMIGPGEFCRVRGEWGFVQRFGTPEGLPERFQLVRIALGVRRAYPEREIDIYGWEMTFGSFRDHLAYTFVHELHHFRRDHLGGHKGEGEHSATKWALGRLQHAGFDVHGLRLPVKRRRRARKKELRLPEEVSPEALRRTKLSALRLSAEDLRRLDRWIRRRLAASGRQTRSVKLERHFEKLRGLPEGAPVLIRSDDSPGGYTGQLAVKVRSLRRNSPRMQIRTADGREWHWMMEWLDAVEGAGEASSQPMLFPEGQ